MTHAHPAAAEIDLVGFMLLGLLGSVAHCVPMCSPFAIFVSRRYASPGADRSATAAQLWYSAGRIITYAALGAAAGAFGGLVDFAGAWIGLQRGAAFLAGSALIVFAILALGDRRVRLQPHAGWIARLMSATRAPGHPLVTGVFLGFLPCGLLYTAVIAAVGRGTAIGGATALVVFGAGTAPALFGVSLAAAFLAGRPVLNRLSMIFVLLMGVWFLWAGYRSP